jgi:predicted negative regulator of RcsB-dependent stress response
VDRITRKDLKTDHFVTTVQQTLESLSENRKKVQRITMIAAAVLVAVIAVAGFMRYQASQRQAALNAMFRQMEAPVAEPGSTAGLSFATQQEKEAAVQKAVEELSSKYSGTNESAVANYFRGTDLIEEGNVPKGIEHLDIAIREGSRDTKALASFAKANALRSQGKIDEAETLLRSILDRPGGFVTKDQVTLALADLLAESKPDEAMKLLEPLRVSEGTVQRLAARKITEIRKRQEGSSAN